MYMHSSRGKVDAFIRIKVSDIVLVYDGYVKIILGMYIKGRPLKVKKIQLFVIPIEIQGRVGD